MSRTAGPALLVIASAVIALVGLALALPVSPPQDPMAGARVFSRKGCAACHAPAKSAAAAPDLRHIGTPRTLDGLASAMWNHRAIPTASRLDGREAGDLIAFLFVLNYFGTQGDPKAGQRLFVEKGCAICHQAAGTGGVFGPSLEHLQGHASPMLIVAAMWNHGPDLAAARETRRITRPRLNGAEVRDLVAYLNAGASATSNGPLHMFPGDPQFGRAVFEDRRCGDCHKRGESGPFLANLRTRRDFSDFAAAMWNKAPAMVAALKKQGRGAVRLLPGEMADLVAHLEAIGYFAYAPNAVRGHQLFMAKGCAVCHPAWGLTSSLRATSRPEPFASPPVLVALGWNHAILIENAGGQAKAAQRALMADEIGDLVAFMGATHRVFPETTEAP